MLNQALLNSFQGGQFYDVNGRPLAYLADGVTAFVALAASGQVVAAQGAGNKIRVLAFIVSALATTNVKFQSAATDISLTMYLAATAGVVASGYSGAQGWFETAANEALNLNMSAATSVGVQVIYAVVK